MKLLKLNRKGFSHVEIAITVLVVAVLGFIGYRVATKNTSHAGSVCSGHTYQLGSTGRCVTDIQKILNGFNKNFVATNGTFGPLTKSGVLAFQHLAFPKDKTQWDGIVGPNTWSKLCNKIPNVKNSLTYNAQKDACGKATYKLGGSDYVNSNLGIQYVGEAAQDSYGNIWIGSIYYDGNNSVEIYKVFNPSTGKIINSFNLKSQLGSDDLHNITSDGKGHMWFTSWSNNSQSTTLYEVDAKTGALLSSYDSRSLSESQGTNIDFSVDSLGNVWVFRSSAFNVSTNSYDSNAESVYEISNGKLSTFLDGSNGNIPDGAYAANIYNDVNGGSVYIMFFLMNAGSNTATFEKFTNNTLVSSCLGYDIDSYHSFFKNGNITSLTSSMDQSYGLDVGAVNNINLGTVFNTNNYGYCLETKYAKPSYSLYTPNEATLDQSGNIWIASNGSLTLKGSAFNPPTAGISESVAEINPVTGNLIKLLNSSEYKFNSNLGSIIYDSNGYIYVLIDALWSSDGTKMVSGATIDQINASTGKLVNIYQ